MRNAFNKRVSSNKISYLNDVDNNFLSQGYLYL